MNLYVIVPEYNHYDRVHQLNIELNQKVNIIKLNLVKIDRMLLS